jgi:hypothetical protein
MKKAIQIQALRLAGVALWYSTFLVIPMSRVQVQKLPLAPGEKIEPSSIPEFFSRISMKKAIQLQPLRQAGVALW